MSSVSLASLSRMSFMRDMVLNRGPLQMRDEPANEVAPWRELRERVIGAGDHVDRERSVAHRACGGVSRPVHEDLAARIAVAHEDADAPAFVEDAAQVAREAR